MGERIIPSKFNVHENYKRVNIVNPYRHDSGGGSAVPENEIAYFEMENPVNGLVDTYGNYSGTITGSVASVAGKVGNAFQFSNGSYAQTAPITMPAEWAIEFWLYKNNSNTQYIVDRNGSVSSNRITIYADQNNVLLRVNNASRTLAVDRTVPNHIILTGGATTFDGFLNGATEFQAIPGAVSGEHIMYLGIYKDGNQLPLNGWVDEFRIHSKRLTTSEALDRYNSYL